MSDFPRVIVQVPAGGALRAELREHHLPWTARGEVVVQDGPADAGDRVSDPTQPGQVVLTVPAPEALEREAETLRRVIGDAEAGGEPLIVVVEAAEQLRQTELQAVVEAARHTSRVVILRVIRDA